MERSDVLISLDAKVADLRVILASLEETLQAHPNPGVRLRGAWWSAKADLVAALEEQRQEEDWCYHLSSSRARVKFEREREAREWLVRLAHEREEFGKELIRQGRLYP